MKVLLTATVQSHICQFHKPLVEVLREHDCEIHVAARNNLAEKNGLKLDFVDKVYDLPFARSPKSLDNVKAYKQLKKIINEEHYDVIHCNTPMGGIVTRLASRKARKNGARVIYTAHGFHFYKGASKKNWIFFYPIEKLFSRLTDTLITITNEDYELAKKKFHCQVEHIHGVGVSTQRYHDIAKEEQLRLRKIEGLSEDDFIVLCVGELNNNKNQKTLISAVEKIYRDIPNLKVLLAGNGPNIEILKKQISESMLEDKVLITGYRTDLENITPFVDLVVSCSYREGLPLNILEAELCKKVVIASINRGHKELVEDLITGYLVEADDVDSYAESILSVYKDKNRAINMGLCGYEIAKNYTSDVVKAELKKIYFGNLL